MARVSFIILQGIIISFRIDPSGSIRIDFSAGQLASPWSEDTERDSKLPAQSEECAAWTVNWFTKKMWEVDYVPHQVLQHVPQREHNFVAQQMPVGVRRSSLTHLIAYKNYSSQLDDCTIAVLRFRGRAGASACRDAINLEERFHSEGKRHAYIVVGEENDGCNICPSFYSRAPMVFRQYYSDDCEEYYKDGSMMAIPLGVKNLATSSGLNKEKPASERKYIWSFLSESPNAYRDSIVSHFRAHAFVDQTEDNVYVRYPHPYKSDMSKYSSLLCDSKFVLSPKGHHEDCWRLSESMNCGAIPVVTDGGNYFQKYMPKNLTDLFITFGDATEMGEHDWGIGFDKIDSLLKDKRALDEWQRRIVQAYKSYQESWRAEVARRLAKVRVPSRLVERSI